MRDGGEIDKVTGTPISKFCQRHDRPFQLDTGKSLTCFQSLLVRMALHKYYSVRGGAQGTGIAVRSRIKYYGIQMRVAEIFVFYLRGRPSHLQLQLCILHDSDIQHNNLYIK